jgi:hypothetical protein
MAKKKKQKRPVILEDFKKGERFPDYVAWSFDGCNEVYGFDMSKLSVDEQTFIFTIACDAEPEGAEATRRAAAQALWDLAQANDWLYVLK